MNTQIIKQHAVTLKKAANLVISSILVMIRNAIGIRHPKSEDFLNVGII